LNAATFGLLLAAASLFVALVGVAADEWRDRRARHYKRPRWTAWSRDEFLPRSSQHSAQEPKGSIICPSVTRIAFWNDGSQTIQRTDNQTADRLRIVCAPGAVLLDATLVRRNSRGNQLQVNKTKDGDALLDFNYLKPKQGAIIDVIHSS